MNDILTKFKEEFITVAIGLLIGLPAMGILLPDLFGTIASISSGKLELSCLFKLFGVLYFTLPFFILQMLLLFLLKDKEAKLLARGLGFFVLSVMCILVPVLFIHSRKAGIDHVSGFFIFLIVCWSLLCTYTYIRWFCLSIIKISSTNESPLIDKKIYQSTNLFIRFNVIILFIPIQWIISILLTVFTGLIDSLFFFGICLLFYFLPLYINLRHPSMQKLKQLGLASKQMVPISLGLLATALSFIMYISQSSDRSWNYHFIANEKSFDSLFSSTPVSEALEERIAHTDYLLQLNTLRKEAIGLKNPIWDKDKRTYFNALGSNFSKLDSSLVMRENSREENIQNRAFISLFNNELISTNSIDSVLHVSREYLLQWSRLVNMRGKNQLLHVIQITQRNGSFIFLSLIIMLMVFLLLTLGMRSTKEKRGYVEMTPIRKALQFVLMFVVILFVPLLKHVGEENIDPSSPWKLFKLPNWNLYIAVTGKGDTLYSQSQALVNNYVSSGRSGCNCCDSQLHVSVNIYPDSLSIKNTLDIKKETDTLTAKAIYFQTHFLDSIYNKLGQITRTPIITKVNDSIHLPFQGVENVNAKYLENLGRILDNFSARVDSDLKSQNQILLNSKMKPYPPGKP